MLLRDAAATSPAAPLSATPHRRRRDQLGGSGGGGGGAAAALMLAAGGGAPGRTRRERGRGALRLEEQTGEDSALVADAAAEGGWPLQVLAEPGRAR